MTEPFPCRYVFLDVAGTLLEKPDLPDAVAGALRAHGIAVESTLVARRHKLVTEMHDVPNQTNRAFYTEFNRALLLALGVVPDDDLVGAIYDACADLPWRPAAGADRLAALPQPVGVVSNWGPGLEALLMKVAPVTLFRVVDSTSTGFRKPDTRLFQRALDGLDCPPGEVAFVGDSVRLDMAPAAATGMRPVLYDPLDLFAAYRGPRIARLDELNAMLRPVQPAR